jgi:thiol:disulfide interchange protein DsbD
MQQIARILCVLLTGLSCFAADFLRAPPPKTKVSLLLSHTAARPGETITAALRLDSEPGWHTYWRNEGDAGIPTSIEWILPPGITASQIEWPAPEKLVILKLFAYVYEREILLPVPLHIAANAKPGTVALKGSVGWLECSESNCVPQDGKVSNTLVIGGESTLSPDKKLIEEWRARIPKPKPDLVVTASWELTKGPKVRRLVIEWVSKGTISKPDFYPFKSENFTVKGETEILQANADKIRLRKPVELENGSWPDQISGLVLDQTGERPTAFEVTLSVPPLQGQIGTIASTQNVGQPQSPAPIELGGAKGGPSSLWAIFGLAFLGGLILNIMPCVLPVIALKILGFVNQSREEPKRVRQLGLLYMLGVLTSFAVLAGVLLGARRAAGDVNWGMQMQNPYFVVGMTVLVTLVALNLWGVFEITLSGGALGTASELAGREGRSGAFYNGVLATLLATPCTAPALGAAVGAVLTQPDYIVVITFLMIGLGLALPYVALSWNPGWLKLLPKPGAWMEKFKMAMGFPMAATAVWMWSFGARHFGKSGGLWLGLFLVFIGLAAWIYGDFVQRGAKHRGLARVLAILVLLTGYSWTLEAKLHWRHPPTALAAADEIVNEPGGITWKRWSPEAVTKARAEGHPVLVDFTADWCFTCQVNKQTGIEVDSVKAKLKELSVETLVADFTLRDPKIGAAIRAFNRPGVPLVVVYPADALGAPILVEGQPWLTPGIVLNALDLATKNSRSGSLGEKVTAGF